MRVILVNYAASKYSLHVAHTHILVLNFLVNEVRCPDLDAIVVDGHQLGVGVVVKAYLVCSVCSDWVPAEGFAS